MQEIELSYIKKGSSRDEDNMKTLDKYRNTDDLMIEEQQIRVDREEHKKQFNFTTASKYTEEGPDNHNFSPS
jgi:hypothetical protein